MKYSITQHHLLTRRLHGIPSDQWKGKGLTRASQEFASTVLANFPASHVVLARDRGVVVGWFRCTLSEGTLYANGTWVDKGYRGRGISKALWLKAVSYLNPSQIHVDAVSYEGYCLIRSLRAESNLPWKVPYYPMSA